MKKLFLIGMTCWGLSASAQLRQTGDFIYLKSDSIVHAEWVQLRPSFTGDLQLRADSRRFPLSWVKFFNNEDGFFAVIHDGFLTREPDFAERIIEGKINVYEKVSYTPYHPDFGYHRRFGRSHGVDVSRYYNKGYQDVQRLRYASLSKDLADNPESMQFLTMYRKNVTTSKVLYGTAVASLITSLILFVADQKKLYNSSPNPWNSNLRPSTNGNITGGLVLMGAGIGLAGAGYLVGQSANGHLENAVDAYNR